jgi:hypothetical protein
VAGIEAEEAILEALAARLDADAAQSPAPAARFAAGRPERRRDGPGGMTPLTVARAIHPFSPSSRTPPGS